MKMEKIQESIDLFNEQHENSVDITTDPSLVVEQLADCIIESEDNTYTTFSVDNQEYTLYYCQFDGRWSCDLRTE